MIKQNGFQNFSLIIRCYGISLKASSQMEATPLRGSLYFERFFNMYPKTYVIYYYIDTAKFFYNVIPPL